MSQKRIDPNKTHRHTYKGKTVEFKVVNENSFITFLNELDEEQFSNNIKELSINSDDVYTTNRVKDLFFKLSLDAKELTILKSLPGFKCIPKIYFHEPTKTFHKGNQSLILVTNTKITNQEVTAKIGGIKTESYKNFYCIEFNNALEAHEKYEEIENEKKNSTLYDWIDIFELNFSSFDYYPSDDQLQKKQLDKNNKLPFQEAYNTIKAKEVLNVYKGCKSVKLAILDTGVDLYHNDLKNSFLVDESYDFIKMRSDQAPRLNDGHGTSCAGLISGYNPDKEGVIGVGKGCSLISYRIGFSNLKTDIFRIIIAFLKASFKENVKVINCSWNLGPKYFCLEKAIKMVIENGTSVVVAAGNNGVNSGFPACMKEVITVTGLDKANNPKQSSFTDNQDDNDDDKISYDWASNYGENSDLAAPAENLVTTDILGDGGESEGAYSIFFMTSAAAPQVTGCIGLMLSQNPTLNPCQIKQILLDSVTPFVHETEQNYGVGILNVKGALEKSIS